MPLIEFNGETWEEDVIPDVVHVEMKNVLVPGNNKPFLTTKDMNVPTSQKTQMTIEMDSTDEESDDSSLSHVDTTKKRHAVFRCLMQVFFPFKRTLTTEEFFASFRIRRPQRNNDDDSERSINSMSDISILALPETDDEPSKKQEERSKRKLFRGRRIARSRKVRGWTDSVVVKEELSGSCRAGLAP